MRYEIVLSPDACAQYRRLPANRRGEVRDAIERHLRNEPARTSKSRIKRLRGLTRPQYRLRTGDIRIYYDVVEGTVEILAIVPKSQAVRWLEESGDLP